jgi:hypothetical protein
MGAPFQTELNNGDGIYFKCLHHVYIDKETSSHTGLNTVLFESEMGPFGTTREALGSGVPKLDSGLVAGLTN